MKYFNVFFERVHNVIVGLAISILIARNLGVQSFGTYKTLISYITIASLVFYFSLDDILVRYIPELKRNKSSKINNFLRNIIILRVITFLFILLLLLLFKDSILYVLNIDISQNLFYLFIFYLFIISINNLIGRAFITSDGRRSFLSVVLIIKDTVKLVALLFLIFIDNLDIVSLFFSLFILEVLIFSFYLANLLKRLKYFSSFSGDSVEINGRVVRYGLANYLRQSSHSFRDTSVDIAVVTAMGTASAVGYFGIAAVLSNFLRNCSLFKVFYGIFFPEALHKYDMKNVEDREKLITHYKSLDRIQAIVLFPLVIVFAILVDDIITLFYSDVYLPAVPCSIVLIVGMYFVNMSDVYYVILNLMEHNKVIAIITFISGAANFILDILLVYNFGFIGAAFATSTVSIFVYFFLIAHFKIKKIKIYQNTKFYLILIFVNMPIIIFGFFFIVSNVTFLTKIIISLVFFILSVFLGYSFAIEKYDKNKIINIIKRVIYLP